MLLCYKVVFGVLCVENKVYQLFLEETLQTDCVPVCVFGFSLCEGVCVCV